MKAVIVEDNPGAVNVLKAFLKEYPGGIDVCGSAQTVERAKQLILEEQPDLWFLDIRLHDKIVFSLIHELGRPVVEKVAIVFITAYYEPEYIHEALKISALDFIVKPIDRDQLFVVLDKAKERISKTNLLTRIVKLEESVRSMDSRISNRLPVHRVNGEIDYEDKWDIVYIKTEDDVTRIVLRDERIVGTTKPLKFYEDLLQSENSFLRISKQVILNLEYLKSYNPKMNSALLVNGSTIQISRRRSAQLLQILSGKK